MSGYRRSSTTVTGGPNTRRKLLPFELVEINPIIDVMNKTARLSVGLVSSVLEKKIL
jgi:arginase family enzyme